MSGKLTLDRAHGQRLLREMLRIRRFEAKCVELYQAQKIRGFLHLYDGQEAAAVGVMQALDEGDAVVSTYRDHGHALARGVGMGPIMAEMLGKVEGCSRGRGGSDLPPSEWSMDYHILDHEGEFGWLDGGTSLKRSLGSFGRRRLCWRRAALFPMRAGGLGSRSRPIIAGARSMAA